MPRYAARVDASQEQIVSALRAAGASVYLIGRPVDAVVGIRGQTLLMEFKTPGTHYGKKLNDNQQAFKDEWRGFPIAMVDGAESALRALSLLK